MKSEDVTLSPAAVESLEAIGGEGGFWKSGTMRGLQTVYKELVAAGCTEAVAIDAISGVFETARGEYGD